MQPVTCKKRIKRASCGKALLLLLKPEKAANRDSITSKVFGDGGVEVGRGEEGPFWRKVPLPPSKPLLFLSKDFRKWDRI